jgi:hypothetical protein
MRLPGKSTVPSSPYRSHFECVSPPNGDLRDCIMTLIPPEKSTVPRSLYMSYLKCGRLPNGDIAFSASNLDENDVTRTVTGTAHPRRYGVGGIPISLPPKAEGQWIRSDHQGIITSGDTTNGVVTNRNYRNADPERMLETTEMMVQRAAGLCNDHQGKHNFRPPRMDFRLF